MASITVRNIPVEVHRALRLRAAANGRSTEAEVRDILAKTAMPEKRLKIGTELRRFWVEHDFPELDLRRDPAPIEPARFE
jgi:antitoxin FitA